MGAWIILTLITAMICKHLIGEYEWYEDRSER